MTDISQAITRYDVEFTKDRGIVLPDDTSLKGYIGVNKFIYHDVPEPAWLTKWKAENPDKQKQVQKRGQDIHSAYESEAEIQKIYKNHRLIVSEILLYSEIYGIKLCGFVDAILASPIGEYIIVDFKTKEKKQTVKASLEQKLQVFLYRMMLKEQYGLETDNLEITYLFADGTKPKRCLVSNAEHIRFLQTLSRKAHKLKLKRENGIWY